MKTNLSAITIATILFAVFFSASRLPAGEAGPGGERLAFVTVGKVGEADAVEIKRYTGHVISSSSVDLVARVSGELLRLGFKEGDMVEQGQVLYELDPVRYEAEVRNIEARIAEYEAKLAYAEISFNRAKELYAKKAGTMDSMDSSESEHKAARAALMAAEAQLITMKDDLKNTRILAPITGKIGVTRYTEGNYLTPNSGVIATIIQLDPLRVSFSMSNRDYLAMFGSEDALKKSAKISLRLADDSIYEREGVVEFVDNRANQKTDAIQIYAKFANPDGKLVPDSTVTVMLSRRNGGKQPAVLPSAVMHDTKTAYVYVVGEGNRVERRDVILGPGDAQSQAIKSGLSAGELVVIDGMHKTMPGGVIEPDFRG